MKMCSRRTIMSGEVVTFASDFERRDSGFCESYKALGNFEVSASRDAVIVHRADCRTEEEVGLLLLAISEAEKVRKHLEPYYRGGEPSKYPDTPTEIDRPAQE